MMTESTINAWLTSADQSRLFEQKIERVTADSHSSLPVITLDETKTEQTIAGFGFSLTGGSAMHIAALPDQQRAELLRELFLPQGIGVSCLRLTIGASDLSTRSFSYNDLPPGQTDFALQQFDIQAGDVEVIPLLQAILAINPDIKFIATAWSAPAWMKTNQRFVGGQLRFDCQAVYAAYLVKYLQAMQSHGIRIHAITPQNEPLNAKNDPSMVMEAYQQAVFIKNHLGPALQQAGLGDIEVFCWDHNCDVPQYPLSLFADPQVRRYLTGSAWHLYAGEISVLSAVKQTYPDMKLYFTEQWVGSDGEFGGDLLWHIKNVLIGSLRNGCSAVFEWNLAADSDCCPHTAGGEARCVGALSIDGQQITRNVAYYIIAHAAKRVRPGSVRIESTQISELSNVAFVTPQGQKVLIALNETAENQSFVIQQGGLRVEVSLPARSVASYCW